MDISRRKTHVDINFNRDILITERVRFYDEEFMNGKPEIHFKNSHILVLDKRKRRIRNLKGDIKHNIVLSKHALRKIWLNK
ncbi:hypothetical protein RSA37_11795 [Mammaliicoccus sciuri]|uniref:hypothetical protein n=1 Tax=Mammaliicoccus sciuri TaxID=1296 RepID=UPI0007346BEE|nr:hypothetical protein [Mammaliicoccus sciuri]KTT82713.1 hypothetical protein NS1R_12055 [Mammaliicoccus sciuri]KTT88230.1 hypothetical protein NS112_09435 [Mammaliicoccus sciuri]KTT89773.1 hypothetical protein NS36R_07960 [Mammaliicoccus sciuri]KTT94165.1 hypothetical protein NS44R_08375 [Mammaliicoccus sciuri]KTW10729.1 hypothetical protein RSA37_11795 [Mammaliicoccus sciuri]